MPRKPFVLLKLLLTAFTLVAVAPPFSHADDIEEELKADLKLFTDAKLPHGDQDLIDFFKSRLLAGNDRQRIEGFIQGLGSNSFKERERARVALVKEGPAALPLLRAVLQGNPELEVKLQAEQCLKAIEKKAPNTLVLAAARLLRHRRVEGAATVLMEYVAVAPDDAVEEEVAASIYALALTSAKLEVLPPTVKAGKLDPTMMTALADQHPKRRAIAALVVARYGDAGQREAITKLLQDPVPEVRLRAAHGLLLAGEKSGVPGLVDLLLDAPMSIALQAEDLLGLIGEDRPPSTPLGESQEARRKCQADWKDWWDKNKADIDVSKVPTDMWFNWVLAKNAAVKLENAYGKADGAALNKLMDVPFRLNGVMVNTRAELERQNQSFTKQPPQLALQFKIGKVVRGREYAKSASEEERNFLEKAGKERVYVVYIEVQWGGQTPVTIPMLFRISGGQALCIGEGKYVSK